MVLNKVNKSIFVVTLLAMASCALGREIQQTEKKDEKTETTVGDKKSVFDSKNGNGPFTTEPQTTTPKISDDTSDISSSTTKQTKLGILKTWFTTLRSAPQECLGYLKENKKEIFGCLTIVALSLAGIYAGLPYVWNNKMVYLGQVHSEIMSFGKDVICSVLELARRHPGMAGLSLGGLAFYGAKKFDFCQDGVNYLKSIPGKCCKWVGKRESQLASWLWGKLFGKLKKRDNALTSDVV
jgi:hypothetical protein